MNHNFPDVETKIYERLDSLNIRYNVYEHPHFDSCEVSSKYHASNNLPGVRSKNLFLRNKNGKKHFLLVLPHSIDFNKTRFREISEQKCGFADSERLMKYLGTTPGSVSPFSLICDTQSHTVVYIEDSLLEAEYLHLHPNRNDKSIQIKPQDVLKFIDSLGNIHHEISW